MTSFDLIIYLVQKAFYTQMPKNFHDIAMHWRIKERRILEFLCFVYLNSIDSAHSLLIDQEWVYVIDLILLSRW